MKKFEIGILIAGVASFVLSIAFGMAFVSNLVTTAAREINTDDIREAIHNFSDKFEDLDFDIDSLDSRVKIDNMGIHVESEDGTVVEVTPGRIIVNENPAEN